MGVKSELPIKKKIFRWLFTDNITIRDEWVKDSLEKIPDGKTILDAGAGEQKYKKWCGHLNYVSQDFCLYDGKGNNTGVQTGSWDTHAIDIVGDIWNIDVPSETVDVILCTEVFEHIPYPIETCKEFSRVLKKHGTLLLSAPFCSLTHFAPYHYYSGFNSYFYEEILGQNGFIIDKIERNGNFFDWIRQELARLPQMTKRYTGRGIGPFYYIFMVLFALKLKLISAKDRGSGEVLCFGYQIIAHKE